MMGAEISQVGHRVYVNEDFIQRLRRLDPSSIAVGTPRGGYTWATSDDSEGDFYFTPRKNVEMWFTVSYATEHLLKLIQVAGSMGAQKVASYLTPRDCFLTKAVNEKWYAEVEDFDGKLVAYGPFYSPQDANRYVKSIIDFPEKCPEDDSMTQNPPRNVKPPKRVAGYSGNPDGKDIYPNKVDHGYDEPLAGGTDVMRRLQNRLVHEQGDVIPQRPESPRLAGLEVFRKVLDSGGEFYHYKLNPGYYEVVRNGTLLVRWQPPFGFRVRKGDLINISERKTLGIFNPASPKASVSGWVSLVGNFEVGGKLVTSFVKLVKPVTIDQLFKRQKEIKQELTARGWVDSRFVSYTKASVGRVGSRYLAGREL